MTARNLICFSTADWDTLLPTNKHQLMRRFAARGHRVLYIETLGTRAPRVGSGTDLKRIGRRLLRSMGGARKQERRLWTVSPLVRPVWRTATQIALNRTAFSAQVGGMLEHFPDRVAWIYSPYAVYLLDAVKPELVVYHLVDDLGAVPGADRESIREAEAQLLARADLVFCSERSLYDRARRISSQCHFMPNVADYHHFSQAGAAGGTSGLAKLRAMTGPRVIFSGNITPHKVDLELMGRLAAARSDWQWIMIGPTWEGADASPALRALESRRNVHFLGHVAYEDLPAYLHEADALIIPYRQNEATRAVFPLKLFEYLATGKPVVASPLPSLLPYRGIVRIAETVEEWTDELAGALADPHGQEAQRRALARRHTWAKRVREMERLLDKALG